MLSRYFAIVIVTAGILCLSTTDASAQFVVRAIGGTATEDVYGFGFGGSAGFNLPIGSKGYFLGARAVYHTGQDRSVGLTTTDTGLLMYGIEFGGTWIKSPILIKPVGTLGVASTSVKNLTGGSLISKATSNKFMFGPGFLVAIPAGPILIGVEPRYLQIYGGKDSFVIYGTAGLSL